MTRFILITAVLSLLAACSPRPELQTDPAGSDAMSPSPCACANMDYEPPRYTWKETA